MNKTTLTTALLLALSTPMLGACNQPSSSSSPPSSATPTPEVAAAADSPKSVIGKAVAKGMRQARADLETSNLSLNGGVHISKNGKGVWAGDKNDGLPKAEITPKGDLLIEGKTVVINASQRGMLLDYRHDVIDVAGAGMDIGTQASELASKAVAEGLASIFDSDSKKGFEQRMDAEGKKIEASARKLCDRLPAMLDSQEKLAASLPEFKPYASMTQGDIDDCMDDHGKSSDHGPASR